MERIFVLKTDDGCLSFYGNLIRLMVNAKYNGAELLNSNSLIFSCRSVLGNVKAMAESRDHAERRPRERITKLFSSRRPSSMRWTVCFSPLGFAAKVCLKELGSHVLPCLLATPRTLPDMIDWLGCSGILKCAILASFLDSICTSH